MELNLRALLEYYLRVNNMTINQLADRSGVSQSYLNEIFNGKKDNPGIARVEMIVDAFGITLSEFFVPVEYKEREKTLDERVLSLPASKRELIEKMVEELEKNANPVCG